MRSIRHLFLNTGASTPWRCPSASAPQVIGHQVQDPPGVIQTDVDAVTNSLDLPARLDSQGLTVRKDETWKKHGSGSKTG